MTFNPKDYRIFNTTDEADGWINQHYKNWLKHLQKDKDIEGSIAYCFNMHTGFGNKIHNAILRGYKGYSVEEIKDEYKIINPMINEIRKYKIPDNIIVYRYVKKKFLKDLFKEQRIKTGECFSDKAILSTTMLKNELRTFALQNQYDCLLRLHLPKDSMGVYVQFNDSCLREYEILLPPNTMFRLVKKRFGLPWYIYDCVLISQ